MYGKLKLTGDRRFANCRFAYRPDRSSLPPVRPLALVARVSVSDSSIVVVNFVFIVLADMHDAQPSALAAALALHMSEVRTCGGRAAKVVDVGWASPK